jgi:hypothetical protein
MIEQAYDRDSVRRYVAAVRGVVGSDQLGEATAAAAQVIPGEGDPQAKVRAVLPGPGTADVSSGGAEGQTVPYLSREPAVSLVQSAVSGALREQGVGTGRPWTGVCGRPSRTPPRRSCTPGPSHRATRTGSSRLPDRC